MLQFSEPVEFLGTKTKSGKSARTGNDYSITEAAVFVPRLGRVKVAVEGNPKFPDAGQKINLALSVDQGSFQSLKIVWDEQTQFKAVA